VISPAIQLDDVALSFGKSSVLRGVSLSIQPGEVVGLLGPNGAGKSTTQSLIAGWYPPTSGTIRVFGSPAGASSLAGKVGAMGPTCPLDPSRTIRAEFVRHSNYLGLDPQRELERWLAPLSLETLLPQRIENLSEGERRRAELACALLGDPALLLLDEPMAGLDPSQVESVQTLLSSRPTHQTVIISSNRLTEINTLCDRVIVIIEGKVALDRVLSPQDSAIDLYFSAVSSYFTADD
jgi:ABC-2 type transport system ATP-binding protein